MPNSVKFATISCQD